VQDLPTRPSQSGAPGARAPRRTGALLAAGLGVSLPLAACKGSPAAGGDAGCGEPGGIACHPAPDDAGPLGGDARPVGDDDTPPPAVLGLVAKAASSDLAVVSWQPPGDPDVAGVLVARLRDGTVGGPVPRNQYAVGDTFAGSKLVIHTGPGTSVRDTGLAAGVHVYAAWTYDAAGNFGPPRYARAILAPPAQSARLQVTAGSSQVTFTEAAAHLGITGAASYSAGNSTLAITLEVENRMAGVAHNLKLAVTELSKGTFSNADGTLDGKPYRYYGPEGLASGQRRSRTLLVTGVASGDQISLRLLVSRHPLLIGGHWHPTDAGVLFDTGTGARVGALPVLPGAKGTGGRNGKTGNLQYRGGTVSLDGRLLYLGSRMVGRIFVVDLTTLTLAGSFDLSPAEKATVYDLQFDRTRNRLYAAVSLGAHGSFWQRTATGAVLVAWDAATQSELGRVPLALITGPELPTGTGSTYGAERYLRVRSVALSPDGARAAVAVASGLVLAVDGSDPADAHPSLHIVDLEQLVELDTDPAQAGTQPVDLTGRLNPVSAVYAADGRKVYVGRNRWEAGGLVEVDLSTYGLSNISLPGNNEQLRPALRLPDGKLYFLGNNTGNLLRYDPATGAGGSVPGYAQKGGAACSGGGSLLYVARIWSNVIDLVDTSSGNVLRSFTGTQWNYGHWLAVSDF
jgi:hypothetical protein